MAEGAVFDAQAVTDAVAEGIAKIENDKPFDWQKNLAGKKIMVHPQLPVCQPNSENDDLRRN